MGANLSHRKTNSTLIGRRQMIGRAVEWTCNVQECQHYLTQPFCCWNDRTRCCLDGQSLVFPIESPIAATVLSGRSMGRFVGSASPRRHRRRRRRQLLVHCECVGMAMTSHKSCRNGCLPDLRMDDVHHRAAEEISSKITLKGRPFLVRLDWVPLIARTNTAGLLLFLSRQNSHRSGYWRRPMGEIEKVAATTSKPVNTRIRANSEALGPDARAANNSTRIQRIPA
jgi:hypothetical protein